MTYRINYIATKRGPPVTLCRQVHYKRPCNESDVNRLSVYVLPVVQGNIIQGGSSDRAV